MCVINTSQIAAKVTEMAAKNAFWLHCGFYLPYINNVGVYYQVYCVKTSCELGHITTRSLLIY
jgi:hypothetical protein